MDCNCQAFCHFFTMFNKFTYTCTWALMLDSIYHMTLSEECGGSVVECSTQDRGVGGTSLTGGTALCP